MKSQQAASLRDLPSVDFLLRQHAIESLLAEHSRAELTRAVQTVLDDCREQIRGGASPAIDVPTLALRIREELFERTRPRLRRVINATGIVLHTNLGRAPLASEAVDAVVDVARGYCNLELDLETGQRGDRHEHVRGLLAELSGAEDALVVNNNAAATFLALNSLAVGRSAVISRGELVEIGGSYRIPDIMAAAGCRMIEVGTTNRTRIGDYERAIDDQTALLVRVHTSNYRIRGFVESATLGELAALARRRGLVLLDDLGSGLMDRVAESAYGACRDAWDEPTVRGSVAGGSDLTLFSGDKLLGGPQAGVIVGRSELLARLRKNPLMRALRPDKLTLAALEATLRLHRNPETLAQRLPVFALLARPAEAIRADAEALAESIRSANEGLALHADVVEESSEAGGGSLPTHAFPTFVVRVRCDQLAAEELAAGLRRLDTPVLGRLRGEALLLDCRTVDAEDFDAIAAGLGEVLRSEART